MTIACHLALRWQVGTALQVYGLRAIDIPLLVALAFGGVPVLIALVVKLLRGEFGSDLLAGISIVTSVLLGEYLAGTLVVLMLSGGEALEAYAVRSASSVLAALARAYALRRPPQAGRGMSPTWRSDAVGRRRHAGGLPARNLPGGRHRGRRPRRDGRVVPHRRAVPDVQGAGSAVLSGAINGDTALTIRADKLAVDLALRQESCR